MERLVTPRSLTIPEIHEYVRWYAQTAKNAVEGTGFDGVEFHSAMGFLADQFLQDVSNQRTDEYGGSVQGRSKFGLDVVNAIVEAVGPEKVGIKLSPWKTFQSQPRNGRPHPQFSHFVQSVADAHPNLSYLHVIEPDTPTKSNDFLREIWAPCPYISAGRFNRETAITHSDKSGDLVAFGRWYISNPDLPTRLLKNIPLTPYSRDAFYIPVHLESTGKGYIDYPFADEKQ